MAAEAPKMIRRPFNKVLALKSTGDDYVSKMCAALRCEYLVVRHGMSTQIAGADSPPPRSMLLLIPGVGAYRLLDRDQSFFIMVDSDGIEVQQDRWPGMRFETIDLMTRGVEVTVGDTAVTSEVRYGVASGSVSPYSVDDSTTTDEEPTFPGLKFIQLDGGMRDFRERLKEEADERAAIIVSALQSVQPSRCLGRLMGMRNADLSRLRIREAPSRGRPTLAARLATSPSTTPAPAAQPTPVAPPPVPPKTNSSAKATPLQLPARGVPSTPKIKALAPPVRETHISASSPISNAAYETIARDAYETFAAQVPDYGDMALGTPASIGLFSKDLGTYEIEPTMLECYAVDPTKNRYTASGPAEARRLRVLVNDDQVFFIPES
ncbi:viral inclusion body protein [Mono Lake orbivirus]|nr:viral inclusion body protein [Mono Lake orbivirus]